MLKSYCTKESLRNEKKVDIKVLIKHNGKV